MAVSGSGIESMSRGAPQDDVTEPTAASSPPSDAGGDDE
jgi:hypothetical protein